MDKSSLIGRLFNEVSQVKVEPEGANEMQDAKAQRHCRCPKMFKSLSGCYMDFRRARSPQQLACCAQQSAAHALNMRRMHKNATAGATGGSEASSSRPDMSGSCVSFPQIKRHLSERCFGDQIKIHSCQSPVRPHFHFLEGKRKGPRLSTTSSAQSREDPFSLYPASSAQAIQSSYHASLASWSLTISEYAQLSSRLLDSTPGFPARFLPATSAERAET